MVAIRSAFWSEIDQQFIELQADIDLDNYLAPVNRADELMKFKAAVAEGRKYNPMFEYDPLPNINENQLRDLSEKLHLDDPMERIFFDAIQLRLEEAAAAKTHTSEKVTTMSLRVYGKPDTGITKIARQNLETMTVDQHAYSGQRSGKVYNAQELADICRKAMVTYGFDWKVVVKPEMGAKAAVDNLIREFWIREDVKFHESLVKMMIVHEIGTHVLRGENGYAQPLKIFGRGLPAYQYTEEGLAEYAEEQCGVLLSDTVYRISGRVIGVEAALNGSFWDVYLSIKDYFDVEMAFDIAQRAKLGIADTSQAGSYTKDYMYLAGLHKVRSFFESITQPEIDALFAGKVGFQHLETVRQLQSAGYLITPKVYPEWRTQSNS